MFFTFSPLFCCSSTRGPDVRKVGKHYIPILVKCTFFLSTYLVNLNISTNVSWLFGTKRTPRDPYGWFLTTKKIQNSLCSLWGGFLTFWLFWPIVRPAWCSVVVVVGGLVAVVAKASVVVTFFFFGARTQLVVLLWAVLLLLIVRSLLPLILSKSLLFCKTSLTTVQCS